MTRVKEVRPELEDQRVSEFDVEAFLITIPSYKLPYLGRISTVAQSKIRRLVNRCCNDLDIKLVFTTFKLRNLFSGGEGFCP